MATSPNVNIRNLDGSPGSKYISGAGPHVPPTGRSFMAIQFLAATVVEALVGNLENATSMKTASDNISHAAGSTILVTGTSITLDANGRAIMYFK
tara:strand:+ start:238 stop:522 length:285 start_codon:yes stop_codon:yes gene_type:complete